MWKKCLLEINELAPAEPPATPSPFALPVADHIQKYTTPPKFTLALHQAVSLYAEAYSEYSQLGTFILPRIKQEVCDVPR